MSTIAAALIKLETDGAGFYLNKPKYQGNDADYGSAGG
jgi:hypothetical protein